MMHLKLIFGNKLVYYNVGLHIGSRSDTDV